MNEAAAHLYLLIATYVLDRRFISEPIPLQELVAIMHCTSKTVTEARKRLTTGELQLVDGGQGKATVRFALVKMAGPLYAEQGGAAATACGAGTSVPRSEVASVPRSEVASEPGAEPPSVVPKSAATSVPDSEVAGADTMYPAAAVDPSAAAIDNAHDSGEASRVSAEEFLDVLAHDLHLVDEFVSWWPKNYPIHNSGVLNRVRPADRAAAEALIVGTLRTWQRLQAMAIELWSLRGEYSQSDRSFITKGDRDICVLLHKATTIEREVVRLGLDRDWRELVWEDIVRSCAYQLRPWLTEFRLISDADGVVHIWAPTLSDREQLTRLTIHERTFEEELAASVNRVLDDPPRRVEFMWGDESQQQARTG